MCGGAGNGADMSVWGQGGWWDGGAVWGGGGVHSDMRERAYLGATNPTA